MIIEEIKYNGTNNYLVIDEKTKKAILIDCNGPSQIYLELLEKHDAKLEIIYLTHLHYDHVMGVKELKDKTNANVLIGIEDAKNINNPNYVLDEVPNIKVDKEVKEKDKIMLGDIVLEVLETPGHTKGSTCLLDRKNKVLFSGDTLFSGTYGRCDLPSGNFLDMQKSLIRLFSLDKDIVVLPGHNSKTTIGLEMENII